MVKKKSRKRSKTKLQREILALRKQKLKALKLRKDFLARKKEIEEIRQLKREVNKLKGVGTKREVAKRIGLTGAKSGWKGLKAAGKFIKKKLEAEAAAQDREAAMARKRRKRR